jgi:hypothetical protein
MILTISASVSQPFYNGDWWSVQLDWTSGSNDIFTLYAGSKGYYDGYDGNQILYLASSSIKCSYQLKYTMVWIRDHRR